MRMLLILIITALVGMLLTMATAPAPQEPAGRFISPMPQEAIELPIPRDHGHYYVPALPELQSLEQHNQSVLPIVTATEAVTNIACPKCGKAVWKDLTRVLTSYPCQYPLHCKTPGCDWRGSCY